MITVDLNFHLHIHYICFDQQIWDLRKNDVLYRMKGHSDTVTGLQLSPDGSYLLSNAMDNTGEDCFICQEYKKCISQLLRDKRNTVYAQVQKIT